MIFCQYLISYCFLTSNHALSVSVLTIELVDCLVLRLPRVDYGVVSIDLLRFLTGWRKRRLNQALSVLSLSLGFLSVLYCCLVWLLFVLHWFVFCTTSGSWLLWFGCHLSVPVQVTDCKEDSSPKWPIMIKFICQMTAVEYKIYSLQKKKNKMHNTPLKSHWTLEFSGQKTIDDDCLQLLIHSLCLV